MTLANEKSENNKKWDKIQAQAQYALRIGTCIVEDIAEHICLISNISAVPVILNGHPGFKIETEKHSEDIDRFFDYLVRALSYSRSRASAHLDDKTILFASIEDLPSFIESAVNNYPFSKSNIPVVTKPKAITQDLKPKDLLVLKRDSYLSSADLLQSFEISRQDIKENPLYKFRYLPSHLSRCLQGMINTVHNIKGYPTWDTFYIN